MDELKELIAELERTPTVPSMNSYPPKQVTQLGKRAADAIRKLQSTVELQAAFIGDCGSIEAELRDTIAKLSSELDSTRASLVEVGNRLSSASSWYHNTQQWHDDTSLEDFPEAQSNEVTTLWEWVKDPIKQNTKGHNEANTTIGGTAGVEGSGVMARNDETATIIGLDSGKSYCTKWVVETEDGELSFGDEKSWREFLESKGIKVEKSDEV